MEKISAIINTQTETKKPPKFQWQELALEIIEYLSDCDKKSSIFRCCKQNERAAKFAFEDCKELGKPYTMYFLKVFNINIKR